MTTNKLTDETLSAWKTETKISLGETARDSVEYSHHEAILALVTEIQEHRKAAAEPVLYVMGMGYAFDAETASTCKGAVDSWVGEWNQERLPGQEEYKTVPLYTAQPAPERERIRREHAEWSDKTFGDVGPVGPLKHLSKEALEAAADPSDPLEWADMQFLLWDAQRRMGISDEFITRAMIEKLEINKSRQWPEPKDGEPRLHIKEQPVPVVRQIMRELVSLLDEDQFARIENIALSAGVMPPQPAPVVPDEISPKQASRSYGGEVHGYRDGWNACRAAMLKVNKNASTELPNDANLSTSSQLIPEDLRRAFEAVVRLNNEMYCWTSCMSYNGSYVGEPEGLLKRNIREIEHIMDSCRAAMLQANQRDLSQPVDPQVAEYEQIMLQAGWVVVPVEPTDEMIAAAMECDDVVFDSKDPTAFCVQFREIYCAMVDTAPKQEGNNG